MAERARALIVDADPGFRARLRVSLGAHVDIVGEVPDEEEACAFASVVPVDLIVMSLGRPGADSARELLEPDPALVVVMLNRRGDEAQPAASGHAYARSGSELRGLAGILLGLGSVPRPEGDAPQAGDAVSRISRASRPFTAAHRLAFARLSTFSLRYTFERWNFTVWSLTQRRSASSEFDSPCATS
jgi:CheY-like chemotaxis protein